ncbi:hypothetical protein B5F07_11215 [Lachnoclostridium sp. An169]|nr:hypothetical protein B5F07_11215 [Lachnoclostridium sp. An169]
MKKVEEKNMKKFRNVTKKATAAVFAGVLALSVLTGCSTADGGSSGGGSGEDTNTVGGKILLMSNVSSGPMYDYNIAFMDKWTEELGYTYEVVYGDSANDPAGNLNAVKNAMTSDVVGLIVMQDGGLVDIMTEYPELYVVGLGNDMLSVYSDDGANAAVADNDHFFGTVAGGYANGEDTGKMLAQTIIDAGYEKVAVCMSPAFAYPQYAVADQTIREEIAAYNETAETPIEVVDDEATVLMFKPLDATFFNEPAHQDLDAIIGLCAGQQFIYPPLSSAIASGTANPDTKLITFGMEGSSDLVADVGTGIVQQLYVPNYEEIFFCMAMLDNAIQGKQYSDYTQSEVLDGVYVHISSDEIMSNIENNSPLLNGDMSKSIITDEVAQKYLTRYNPDATYAEFREFMLSDAFSEKAYE